jgi:pimeloyl-ACP methyl ester carboxylesterase
MVPNEAGHRRTRHTKEISRWTARAWKRTQPRAASAAWPCSATAAPPTVCSRPGSSPSPWSGCGPSSGSSGTQRLAGWNGSAADAYVDVREAVERIREEAGPDVPIVLVGHSMGGRAALRAGGEEQVAGVCALAPWTPPGEPVDQLRNRTVAILHGRGDRWVPAALSADFAARAKQAGVPVARFTLPGGHSMLRGAHRWHEFTRDVVLGLTGIEPMPAVVTNALHEPAPEGLAVPL